ncbi:surf-like protein [Malassezia sp. CBS 17886]|nr:surf-like protein [Malassezia sp. CBS 17886]
MAVAARVVGDARLPRTALGRDFAHTLLRCAAARIPLRRHLSTPPTPPGNLPVPVRERTEGEPEPLEYSRPHQKHRRPWYKSPMMYILALVPLSTLWLGFWQIRRLKWKVALIDELEGKLRMEPVRLPKNINMDALDSEFEFRLIEVQGHYDPSRPLFVGPRTREGLKGYTLVLPFCRSSGGADILMNCGFVAQDQVVGKGLGKRLRNPDAVPTGTISVVALLPRVFAAGRFALANEPHNNLWMHLNPPQMAAWLNQQSGRAEAPVDADKQMRLAALLGLPGPPAHYVVPSAYREEGAAPVIPVYLEAVFDGTFTETGMLMKKGIPVGRPPNIELRNQHAEYAFTWFTLAGFTGLMWAYLARRGKSA